MKKCDFCTESNPNGKCYWDYQINRKHFCKIAIKRMMKILKTEQILEKKGGARHE